MLFKCTLKKKKNLPNSTKEVVIYFVEFSFTFSIHFIKTKCIHSSIDEYKVQQL